jgi:anti-sigma-K factor RskA
VAPSPGLKGRVLAAATSQKSARPAMLSRVFWSAAAALLFALLIGNLFRAREYTNEAPIKPTDAAPSARGSIHWVERYVKLEIQGLPALPSGKVYQLWQIGPLGPKAVPAATFTLDSKGDLYGFDGLRFVVAKGHTLALTVEPFGGSTSPTNPIFVVAPVN